MAASNQVLPRRRTRLVAAVLAAAAAAVFMLGIQASAAQACGSNQVCAWSGSGYSGGEYYIACPLSNFAFGIPEQNSAKNNCGGIYVRIGWAEGGATNWKACMSPGGERPDPGRFNVYQRVDSC
jgi:hypothetical protein